MAHNFCPLGASSQGKKKPKEISQSQDDGWYCGALIKLLRGRRVSQGRFCGG